MTSEQSVGDTPQPDTTYSWDVDVGEAALLTAEITTEYGSLRAAHSVDFSVTEYNGNVSLCAGARGDSATSATMQVSAETAREIGERLIAAADWAEQLEQRGDPDAE